jgi:outer membrane protein assembly factor BamE (lipoprotein component of BamABCDE complex)
MGRAGRLTPRYIDAMKYSIALVLALLLAACALERPRSDDAFAAIREGMTRDDARRIVGAPDETMAFPGTRSESWDYYYQDTWGFYCRYSITFGADGLVTGKLSYRLNDGGDHGT